MVAVRTSHGLIEGLENLAHILESLDLKVARVVDPSCLVARDTLVRTIRSYLIPRLSNPEMPLCVVLAGPTGAGKSTLANSLSGMDLSKTGPIRPTTKRPIVLATDETSHYFDAISGVECEIVTGTSPVLTQMALVDTPDIDSTSTSHRAMAEVLIDSADVVVFVTSALRYADEVPWQVLRRAMSRGAPIIHVLNRFSAGSAGAFVDLTARLAEAGITGDILRIPEHHLRPGAQSIPSLAVKELSRRLTSLAQDRDRYQKEVLARVMDATTAGVEDLAATVSESRVWIDDLRAAIRAEFAEAAARVDLETAIDGVLFGDHPDLAKDRVKRRWIKSHRIDDTERRKTLTRVLRRMTVMIEEDLGMLAMRPGDLVLNLSATPHTVPKASVRKAILTELSGWLDFVVRTIAEVDPRDRNLASVVLVSTSLGSVAPSVAETVLGDQHHQFAERARRELSVRIESLYRGAAELAISQLAPILGDPRPGRMLENRARLVESIYFADA